LLCTHPWRGNVRELQNVIEHTAVLVEPGGAIRPEDIPLTGEARTAVSANPASLVATLREESYHAARERVIKQFEKQYLTWLVSRAGGNMSKAARVAGVDRTTLYRLMERHGLQRNPGAAWLVEREAEAPPVEVEAALPPEGAAGARWPGPPRAGGQPGGRAGHGRAEGGGEGPGTGRADAAAGSAAGVPAAVEPRPAESDDQRHQVYRARPRRHRRAGAGCDTRGILGARYRSGSHARRTPRTLPGVPPRPAGDAATLLERGAGPVDLPQARGGDGSGAARRHAPATRHAVPFRIVAAVRGGVIVAARRNLPTL